MRTRSGHVPASLSHQAAPGGRHNRRDSRGPSRVGSAPRRATEAPHQALGLSDGEVLDMYRCMLVSRLLSEQCQRLALQGAIDLAIPSEGHEAAQVGSIRASRPTDLAYLFYRSVPAAYARGMSAREIMLDSFGRAESPSSAGRNIPGNWSKRSLNLMDISVCVGTQIPHAVGTALASKLRREDVVTLVYFGDGGASKGDFHEGLSFAAIHRLPVVLICENNELAISVPFELQSPVRSVADRASGYGVPGVCVDGTDLLAVYQVTRDAVARARSGRGPTLIETRVARLAAHTSQAADLRTKEAIAAVKARDPLPRVADYLRAHGLLDDQKETELLAGARAEVAEAVEYARNAPNLSDDDAYRHVYTHPDRVQSPLLDLRRSAR